MNLKEYNMKICSVCKIEKELCDFNRNSRSKDGHKSLCRNCQKLETKQYKDKNRDKINEKARTSYHLNPKIQREREERWKQNNPEAYKVSIYKKHKKWVENNKERRRKYNNSYNSERLKNDILFKLARNIRIRINRFLKNKTNKSNDILGCSILTLKNHLEHKFIENMSWDNYGDWHIDHIIPLSSAKNEEEIYRLCHYTNLQPLWAEDNLKKSNKILV
jgi:hypothetical protein